MKRFGRCRFLALPVILAACCAPAAAQSPEEAPAVSQEARERLSRLQGRAIVDRNNDVVGATVVIRPHEDPTRVFLTSTGDRGEFRIDGLADGEYDVRLEREGFATLFKERVELRFPFRAVVEVKMTPNDRAGVLAAEPAAESRSGGERISVRGRVLGSSGGALGEIQLGFIRSGGGQDPQYLRSEEDGAFEAADLAPGRWQITVEGVGYLPVLSEVELDSHVELFVYLVQQPADYEPSPLELMLPEQPLPPEGLGPLSNTPR